MCGIYGYAGPRLGEASESVLRSMGAALSHRGPDDEGMWWEADVGVGHRRLSILDLSDLGHQPMRSPSGRWVVVYNGEVYNFREMRKDLENNGAQFRGNSDTEVLVNGFDLWGIEETITRSIGMFALGVWDCQEKELILIRDRLGIKPLYWGRLAQGGILFGSEMHALRSFPGFHPSVSPASVQQYLRFGYVPTPASIYTDVFKLSPGTMLRWCAKTGVRTETYWSAREVASVSLDSSGVRSAGEAQEGLHALLSDAVRLRTVADVPLGAFLSGGVDSSLVTALLAQQSGQNVQTFSIGFEEQAYDESAYARQVSKIMGTEHTEQIVGPAELREVVQKLPILCDEPLADSSLIPTSVLCERTRRKVTVALSGDGGDELFGGYTRYHLVPQLWRKIRYLPPPLRKAGATLLQFCPPAVADFLLQPFQKKGREWGARGEGADMVRKFASMLPAGSSSDLFRRVVSHWPEPQKVSHGNGFPPEDLFDRKGEWPENRSFAETMLYWDQRTFLCDSVLTKVDRASMAHGLEVRVPLLDHRVLEYVWSLPAEWRIPVPGRPKEVLLQLAESFFPKGFFNRPKQGFSLPVGQWMRNELRPWMEDLLEPNRMREQGFLNPKKVEQVWKEHLAGRVNWHYPLWNLAVLQSWLNANHRS